MKTKEELEVEFEKLFSKHKSEYDQIIGSLHKAYESVEPLKQKALEFSDRTGIPFVLGDENYFPYNYENIAGSGEYSYHSYNLDSVQKLTGVYYFPNSDYPPGGWQNSSTQC
jgi:hypothetical protein